jgi:hypothetical protein
MNVVWNSTLYNEINRMQDESSLPLTYKMIAEALSKKYAILFTEEQVRSALRREARRNDYAEQKQRFGVEGRGKAFSAPLDLSMGSVTVIADLHVPYHSAAMLGHMIRMSELMHSRHLVIAGDFFNFDSVTGWPRVSEPDSLQEELEIGGSVILELSQHFDTIYFLNGNHDERLGRSANAHITMSNLVAMALGHCRTGCKIITSDYDYMYAAVSGQPWVFGHLSQFSKRPGEAARKIAEKYGCNIAVGHDHIQGYTSSEDGSLLCISVGAMINLDEDGRSPMWYKERRLTSFAPVQNGFLVLEEGVPYLFNSQGSASLNGSRDWSYWYSTVESVMSD